MASLPMIVPHWWEKRTVQGLVVALCTLPVVYYLSEHGLGHEVSRSLGGYATFIVTLGALYIAAGGVFASADLRATPAVNVGFLLAGT